ncbi:MAG: cytochrome c biogenesis protein CcsA [Actinomycetota bacterium]|nr:cytochrome c biogenesis protein CcsA [Actinomycetota bacterium]
MIEARGDEVPGRSQASFILGAGAVVALASTIVLGLGLPPTLEQGPYARLIAVHPPLAWAAYLAFGVTAGASVLYLWPRTRARKWDRLAGSSAEVGVVFTALTLVTGSIWGRPTWGVWWTWDARLTSTALLLALFLGYLALRSVPAELHARAKRSAVAALVAVLDVPIVHFSVEWWRTLHQGRSLAQIAPQSDLDGSYVAVMLLGFVAMTLVYGWLLSERYRLEVLEEQLQAQGLDAALEERRAEGEPVSVP